MGDKDKVVVSGLSGLGVFVNTYTHTLDDKKRLTIPSDWRESAGEPKCLIVLPGVSAPCLNVYPAREISRRMEMIRNLSIADEQGQHFKRTLASRSDLVPWDAQGRIRIKEDLLAFAGLKQEVMLVGALDHFELWSTDKWKQLSSATPAELAAAARAVGF